MQESDGASSKLASPRSGSSGTTEAVYDVAPFNAGKTIIRWKLVGADGHAVTGTVTFTITGGGTSAEAPPASSATTPPVEGGSGSSSDEPWVAPSALRWLFRYGSYLALLVVAGIVLTDAFVWHGALESEGLRRGVVAGIATAAIAAAGQLLFIASDINGIGSWRAALRTDAGRALFVRIVLLAAVAVLLFIQFNISNMTRVSPHAVASEGTASVKSDATATASTTVDASTAPPSASSPSTVQTTVPPAVAANSRCVLSGTVLRTGSDGTDIACLHARLNSLDPSAVLRSAVFDDATRSAVQRQQRAMGLAADGVVGPATGAALEIWPVGS